VPRWRRRILRIALGLFGFLALCVVLVLVALANLDARPIKGWIQGAAKDQGVDLDYDVAGVTLGGLELRNVAIHSPATDAALAPDLIKIGRIDGKWSLFSRRVDELVIGDVAVTIVQSPDGTTSLDRWLAGMPPSEEPPPTPLSQLLQSLKIDALDANARIEGVTVTVLRPGQPTITLTGLEAKAALLGGELSFGVGPTDLVVTLGPKQATVNLGVSVTTSGPNLTATMTAALRSQSFDPAIPPVKQVLDLAATARFLPAEQRTAVKVERVALVDGAAKISATADLFDTPEAGIRPVLHELEAFLDLAALARIVPREFGPLSVEGEPLRITAKGVELTPTLKGTMTANGRITRLVYQDLEVAGLALDVTAKPDGDGFHASVKLPVAEVHMPGLDVRGVDIGLTAGRKPGALPLDFALDVTVDGVAQPGLGVAGTKLSATGTVGLPVVTVDAKVLVDVDRVTGPAAVDETHLQIDVAKLVLADPATASTGTIVLAGTIADAKVPGTGGASDVTLAATASLGSPTSLALELDAKRASMPSLAASVGPDFRGAPLAFELDATDVALDHADPAQSRGKATFAGRFGSTSFRGKGEGGASDLDYELTAKADRAGPARTIELVSRGHYGKQIRQESTVSIGSVTLPTARIGNAKIELRSDGNLEKHHAEIGFGAAAVTVQGKALGQTKLDLVADVDLRRPGLDLTVRGQKPQADVKLGAALDGNTVKWSVKGKLAKLGSLSGFLPEGPDWDLLVVDLDGKGAADGVVRRGKDGAFVVAPDPAASARGRQVVKLVVKNVKYRGPDEASAEVDAVALDADVTLGEPMVAKIDLVVPAVTALQNGVHLKVKGFEAHVDSHTGKRRVTATLSVAAQELEQSALPSYPIRDLAFSASIKGDPAGALVLETMLRNDGAATTLTAQGELERRDLHAEDGVAGRHSMILEGKLEQDLGKLDRSPDELKGSGQISVPFRVESGDLTVFRVSARLLLAGVSVALPRQKISLTNVRGELPLVQEIVLGPNGVERVGSGANGIYQRLRFSDHRPYLGDADYLAIDEARYGEHHLGPLAGNIRVDRDIIAIDQLEMVALGGKIAGQVLIALGGKDTRVDFRGKLTGIRPTQGEERMDANAALVLVPYKLGMEGRVEIVRISKKHLHDLLNLYDPYRADVNSNLVRKGLIVGYPKKVRLFFQSGFARMEVELGGLAGLARLPVIEGIPIGPSLATWLAPILEGNHP
jgi:hypothetical protein